MLKYSITSILIICSYILFGQNIQITGKVIDEKDVSLPFVSLSVEGTYQGTISNSEGIFEFSLPSNSDKKNLIVSHLGYLSDTLEIKPDQSFYLIKLKAQDYYINEVEITTRDSSLIYLQQAIDKIPENYLDFNSRQTGFYRESLTSEEHTLYFGEAILDVYKKSYKNKENGSVKIVKSRINKDITNDSIPFLNFYGGIYQPLNYDYVKNRYAFLDDANFKKYIYQIDSLIVQGDQKLLKINFSPKYRSNARFKGYLLMDIDTKVIIRIDFTYSSEGKKKRTQNLKHNLEALDLRSIIQYEEIDGKYFFKYSYDSQLIRNTSKDIEYNLLAEYVTTNIDKDNNDPIPYSEQDLYTAIFSSEAEDYSNSTWKDYTTLSLDSTTQLQISNNQSVELLSNKQNQTSNPYLASDIVSFASNMYFGLTMEFKQYDFHPYIQFNYLPNQNYSIPVALNNSTEDYSGLMGILYGYRLSNNCLLFIETKEELISNFYKSTHLGFTYDLALKSYGKRIFISPTISIGSIKYGINTKTFSNTQEFKIKRKTFDADKLSLTVGKAGFELKTGIDFKKELTDKLTLSISPYYSLEFGTVPKLFIKEKSGFFLTRKHANINIENNEHFYIEDQVIQNIKNIASNKFGLEISLELSTL